MELARPTDVGGAWVRSAGLVVGAVVRLCATRAGVDADVLTGSGDAANVGRTVCTDGRLNEADGSAASAVPPEVAWLIPSATVAQPATASEAVRAPRTRPSDM